MPGLNDWWKKYGCDVCDEAQLLVIENNLKPADTRTEFVAYCNTNNVEYPALWNGEGGRAMADALGLGVSANSKLMIRPDKSVKSGVYSSDFAKEGITEHICGQDQLSPVVTIESPIENEHLAINEEYEIKWSATDNVGVSAVTIYFSSDTGRTWELLDSSSANAGTFTWSVPELVSDSSLLNIYAYDQAGNVGNTISRVFKIGITSEVINNKLTIKNSIHCKWNNNAYQVFVPFKENCRVRITDLQGRSIESFVTNGNSEWYTVSKINTRGIYLLHIENSESTVVKKIGTFK